ncbi:hypothetical protein ACJZ2D_012118 [Fusarium nematophilum]
MGPIMEQELEEPEIDGIGVGGDMGRKETWPTSLNIVIGCFPDWVMASTAKKDLAASPNKVKYLNHTRGWCPDDPHPTELALSFSVLSERQHSALLPFPGSLLPALSWATSAQGQVMTDSRRLSRCLSSMENRKIGCRDSQRTKPCRFHVKPNHAAKVKLREKKGAAMFQQPSLANMCNLMYYLSARPLIELQNSTAYQEYFYSSKVVAMAVSVSVLVMDRRWPRRTIFTTG